MTTSNNEHDRLRAIAKACDDADARNKQQLNATATQKQTYVYGDVEVIKTGRVAQRQFQQIIGRQTVTKTAKLVEITPVTSTPGSPIWHKWVSEENLFVVTNSDGFPAS